MISLVFTIAILNFALGVGLAVYLRRLETIARFTPVAQTSVVVGQPRKIDLPESKSTRVEGEVKLDPDPEVEEIPVDWLETLESMSIESSSFLEASVQVLKLEVGRYRESLITVEDQIRECMTTFDKSKIHQLLIELKDLNEEWLEKQADAAGHLGKRRGNLGTFEDTGGALEDVLLDQAAQIETTCSNIELLDFEADIETGCKRLITELGRLVDLAHTLRDRMQDSLVSIMNAENRLGGIDRKMQTDSATELLNRTGLEVLIDEWWSEDAGRERLVSVAMIDIDRFGKLNEQLSTRKSDKIIASFGRLLDELMRKDRGFDRASRSSGETFILFFGDTGPRNATGAVERIRQTIEATSFELDGAEVELTVSCSVTEVSKVDTTATLIKRLKKALLAAKKAGRNVTTIDEGNGPSIVEPPQFQVKGRVVRVSEL